MTNHLSESDEPQWTPLYVSSQGQLTLASQQQKQFYNKEDGTIDVEVTPTSYVGHIQLKIDAEASRGITESKEVRRAESTDAKAIKREETGNDHHGA